MAQAILEQGTYTGFTRGYDRYGLPFSEAIGILISPDGSTIPLFYGEVRIDADNRYHPVPRTRPVKNDGNFLEVWVDPMQFPPYLLLLLGDKSGSCHVFDPSDKYRLVTSCETYNQAQL